MGSVAGARDCMDSVVGARDCVGSMAEAAWILLLETPGLFTGLRGKALPMQSDPISHCLQTSSAGRVGFRSSVICCHSRYYGRSAGLSGGRLAGPMGRRSAGPTGGQQTLWEDSRLRRHRHPSQLPPLEPWISFP